MKYLTQKQYQQELEKEKKKNIQRQYRQDIRNEKKKYAKSFKLETSKLLAFYLFALLNAIVIYAMISMWKFADLSYLGVLISDIAAQILIYAIYCMKAYKAKKSEEELKFKKEKLSGSLLDVIDAGCECIDEVPITVGTVDINKPNIDNTDSLSVG